METLVAVYIESIESGGQRGFEYFDDEVKADIHLQKVEDDIKKYKKELEFKVVKRLVNYDKYNNRVSFN